MNEKNIIFCGLMFVALFTIPGLLSGCASAGKPSGADELEHQRDVTNAQAAIDRLTDRIDQYDSAITDTLNRFETIRKRAETLDGTVDQLTELFDQYDRAVIEMVRKFRTLQAETGGGG